MRFCKLCNRQLAEMNPNDYCFCHVAEGFWLEDNKIQEKEIVNITKLEEKN